MDNADGMFAMRHRALPYLKAGLPASYAEGGDEAAAQGVALLTPGTCESRIGGTDRLAKLDGGQVERLERACDEAEARVRHAAEDRLPAPELNAAAGDAWRRYQLVLDRTLRPEQRARLDAIVGHMQMDGEAHGHGP